ncbi:receptor activity-modifying protein 3 [Denticeps clupeoides]|nr:receptor activity-modifying protein 3-like [Denticeps clupeoides]
MMDINAPAGLKVFMVGILVNILLTTSLSAAENLGFPHSPVPQCNETRLLLEIEHCGEIFKKQMAHVDPQHWCNLTHFISEYNFFSDCTEAKAQAVDCFWPNPLVENYIIQIHKHFFFNCTVETVVWVDPSDDMLAVLILIPILLTLAMIALVVWCSKRSDILA